MRYTMQLKQLQIPAGAVFAPMAGVTDASYRRLMADHGAASVSYTHLDVYKRQAYGSVILPWRSRRFIMW